MMLNTESPYWIAYDNLPGWQIKKKNQLLIKIFNDEHITLEDFFSLESNDLTDKFELNEKEISDIISIKKELPNFTFLAEDLASKGFELVTINSTEYSPTMKKNLKYSSPPLLYVKGNINILQEKAIAIVGSRNANDISLEFTDKIAKKAAEEFKVVSSGFAKGIDKHALECSLKYKGQSIIVLPQGILTFLTGIKQYYKQILNGDVLVISTYHPKAVWSVGLAMARNPIIYALADEIYVAQSDDKGGTYTGVIDGLKKNRKIYVRYPADDENNANRELIAKGAIAVDFEGNILSNDDAEIKTSQSEQISIF